jgi:hypothetical protein
MSIYCHGMKGPEPLEYLTLPTGERENYAEIYDKRYGTFQMLLSSPDIDTFPQARIYLQLSYTIALSMHYSNDKLN